MSTAMARLSTEEGSQEAYLERPFGRQALEFFRKRGHIEPFARKLALGIFNIALPDQEGYANATRTLWEGITEFQEFYDSIELLGIRLSLYEDADGHLWEGVHIIEGGHFYKALTEGLEAGFQIQRPPQNDAKRRHLRQLQERALDDINEYHDALFVGESLDSIVHQLFKGVLYDDWDRVTRANKAFWKYFGVTTDNEGMPLLW